MTQILGFTGRKQAGNKGSKWEIPEAGGNYQKQAGKKESGK